MSILTLDFVGGAQNDSRFFRPAAYEFPNILKSPRFSFSRNRSTACWIVGPAGSWTAAHGNTGKISLRTTSELYTCMYSPVSIPSIKHYETSSVEGSSMFSITDLQQFAVPLAHHREKRRPPDDIVSGNNILVTELQHKAWKVG